MRNLIMGDVHGAFKAMEQCLERSNFDYENDTLIQVGDVTDGYPQVYECVEELLKVKNLIPLKGNHDAWFSEFIKTDLHPYYWTYGGKGTLISYLEHAEKKGRFFATGSGFETSLVPSDIPLSHRTFFASQLPYYIVKKKRCFVHGGFKRDLPFYDQEPHEYYWDRSLWEDAVLFKKNMEKFETSPKFREIYIGHTQTTNWGTDKPLKALNVINVDTGAGHSGRLTIMDIDTKDFWQSDPVTELYPQNYREQTLIEQ
nr:metallophosphoesterase [Mucilaginibacter sp. L294]